MPKCKKISFVSFKGGSGRSVTLANVVFQLAMGGCRVGAVDFDIEGGGLHKIFELEGIAKDSIQHFLMDEEDHRHYLGGENPPDYSDDDVFCERLVIDVKKETNSGWRNRADQRGEVFLIQAKPDARATGLVDTGANLFFRFNRLLERFSRLLYLDCLFIDCRSGISNLSLPGLAYCDLTVVFLRWGSQHRYGTERLVYWYKDWLTRGETKKDIFVVLSNSDQSDETTDDALRHYCAENLGDIPCGYASLPLIQYLTTQDVVLWEDRFAGYQAKYKQLSDILLHHHVDG